MRMSDLRRLPYLPLLFSPSSPLFYQLLRHPRHALQLLLQPAALLAALYQNLVQSLIALPLSLVFHSLYLGTASSVIHTPHHTQS